MSTRTRVALATVAGGLGWLAIGAALICVPMLWDVIDERRDRRVQRAYDEWGSRR